MQLWTYANALTASRIALSPVFIACFFIAGGWGKLAAFLIACLFELTDALDGYIARTRGEVSGIGKLMDPFADSVSRFSVFLCLLGARYVPVWMVAIIFYRDAIVSYLRIGAAANAYLMGARTSGKIKAVVQGVATVSITFLIAVESFGRLAWDVRQIAYWAMAVVTAVTVWSGVDYLFAFAGIVRTTRADRPAPAPPTPDPPARDTAPALPPGQRTHKA